MNNLNSGLAKMLFLNLAILWESWDANESVFFSKEIWKIPQILLVYSMCPWIIQIVGN